MPTSKRGRTPWSLGDIKEILAGDVEDGEVLDRLRTPDRKGLSPVAFAALKAAATADSLTPLLELLDPPREDEVSKMDLVLELLEQIAANQLELAQRMHAIESRLAGKDVPSLSPSTTSMRPVSGR